MHRRQWPIRKAIWLATLGYFVAVELIGRTIRKPETEFQDRRKEWQCFRAGLLEFADEPVSARGRETLWALRCALAHHYQLQEAGKRFVLSREGPLWASPTAQTGGAHWINVLA